MWMTLTGCLLGVLLGLRHALEPDHLAAVSALAAEQRGTRSLLWLGACWGMGHSLSLLGLGGTLVVIERRLPERVTSALELVVALMVMALGARAIVLALRGGKQGRAAPHQHGGVAHAHQGPAEHVHAGRWTLARRPLMVGLVHGLAGSGALTALVLAGLPTVAQRLLYIGLFGLGSVVGMAGLTAAAGVPLQRLVPGSRAGLAVRLTTGGVCFAVGSWWGVLGVGQLLG